MIVVGSLRRPGDETKGNAATFPIPSHIYAGLHLPIYIDQLYIHAAMNWDLSSTA